MIDNMTNLETADDGLLVTGFTVGDAAFGIDARLVLEVVKVGEGDSGAWCPTAFPVSATCAAALSPWWTWQHTLVWGCVEVDPGRLLIMERQGRSLRLSWWMYPQSRALDPERIGAPPDGIAPELRSCLTASGVQMRA